MKCKLKREMPFRKVGEIATVYAENSDFINVQFENNDQRGWQSDCFPKATFSDWFEKIDERWKPEDGQSYYSINVYLEPLEYIRDARYDGPCTSPNCFRTEASARMAAEEIKALLKEFHKNNP